MIVAALDTSTRFSSFALSVDSKVFELESSEPNSQIESLPALFDELLAKASISANEIDKLIIGSGPGSFTGLRIGQSFFTGLATGLSIPLIQAGTFRGVCAPYFSKYRLCLAFADARRDELFVAAYYGVDQSVALDSLEEVLKPQIISVEKIVGLLPELIENYNLDSSQLALIGEDSLLSSEYKVKPVKSLAKGLLESVSSDELGSAEYSLESLAAINPLYLREVAARKISER